MNKEFYNGIETIFKSIIDFLSEFNQSEFLQESFYTLFEVNIYGNLIKNIFSNLTEENMAEHNISQEEVENFRSEFSEVLNDVQNALSNLKLSEDKLYYGSQIDSEYYKKFIKDIKDKFPVFNDFIDEFESEVGLDELNSYLINKKKILDDVGKNEDDIEVVLATRMMEEDIKNSGGLSADLNIPKDFSSEFAKEFLEKTMYIKEWNIWHSYSTFLIKDGYILEDIAYKLVKSDLCPLVFMQDLKIWWKENGEVKIETLEIIEYKPSGFNFKIPNISDRYVLECLNQFLIMWHAEAGLLNEKYRNSFNYIRGAMNPCRFKSGQRPVSLYPQLKIYNNGMLNLLFRQISPIFDYPVESFIEHEVNLFKNEIDEMETAPEIMKLSGRLHLHDYPIISRLLKKNAILEAMDNAIEKETEYVEEGDFSFYYTKVIKDNCEIFNLDDLYGFFTSAIVYVINSNKKGEIPTFSKLKYNFGNYWTLRPSVFITDFKDQPYRSSKIHEDFKNHLGKIMARKSHPFYVDFSNFLGKNLREADDYCLYMNRGLTLWVFSKSGVDYNKKEDPNLSLTYEKQVQVECIDHLNISLKRMSETSSNLSLSYESVLINQLNQNDLEEFFLDDISSFGEINNIFKYASKKLNWDNLRKLIKAKIEIRSQFFNVKRDERYKNLAYLTTLIFGLIGVPTFADKVIGPLLLYYNVLLPTDSNLQILIFDLIAIILTFLFIGFGWFIIFMKLKRDEKYLSEYLNSKK